MYLFSRRARLAGGNGSDALDWAASICDKVQAVAHQEVQLWATVYSPGFGTVSWTTWVPDLATLESIGDRLMADKGYGDLTNQAATFAAGGLDDSLLQPLHGVPEPERNLTYVGGVQAVIAGGQVGRAMAAGVELAMTAASITGLQTMFMRNLTGPYGAVGWLTGYESIAEMESADHALNAEPSWLKTVDHTEGCFVEDPASTQTTIYRRMK
ncbi:MAG: hypothetical protein U0Q22_10190 [Acidimicrobiales bacterium]